MINLKQIKYFAVVAEELHFGRAADRLHISQPPLSTSIRKLEQELGFDLFIRTSRSVHLTGAGRAFYREALQLLRKAEGLQQVGLQIAKGVTGRLRVGFTSSLLSIGLETMVGTFRNRYPGVAVSLVQLNSSDQVEALRQEQIDVGFVSSHPDMEGIRCRIFLSERFVCCLPRDHILSRHDMIQVKYLENETFVIFPRRLSPHYYDIIMALCVNSGFSPIIIHEVNNWLTIVEMVSQALGVALVPESMAERTIRGAIYRPIDNQDVLSDTHCIWRRNDHSVLVSHFLDTAFGTSAEPGKPQDRSI